MKTHLNRIEYADKSTYWRKLNGKLHREDGPAIEKANGSKSWWLNGELHREDGPAVEDADGTKEWWLNDKLIVKGKQPENWNELVALYQVMKVMDD
jgi:hypothetical protein